MLSPSCRGTVVFAISILIIGLIAVPGAQAKTNTTTTVTFSLNPSVYGQVVTFTATVKPVSGTGTPTGTVTFFDGVNHTTKTLSGGKATVNATEPVGTHSINAVYNGDANYNTSTSPTVLQTVNKATTTTVLTSSPNPSTFNQQVTFAATVTGQYGGSVTGTVVFVFGSTQLCSSSVSSGIATCLYSALPVGPDTVSATYGGDNNNSGSADSEVQTVNRIPTTTTLTSSPNPSGYQQQITFTATVSPSPDGGAVTFNYGGTPLCSNVNVVSGVATCQYSNLPVGNNSITASYNGNTNYAPSTSNPLTQVVKPVLQSIVVSPQGLSVALGSSPQQYTAEGYYNDGSQQNITSSVTWSSSNTAVATVSTGGAETPVSAGTTNITAALNPIQGISGLTVDVANTFFVAPNGNDSWSGTISAPNNGDGPFATPSRAQYAIQHASRPATVYLRAGTYYPALTPAVATPYVTNPGTLVFGSADSGTSSAAQVTWAEYPADISVGPAVISGGVPANADPNSGLGLKLTWNNTGNWYTAKLPQYLPMSNGQPSNVPMEPFENLYYNGERRLRSRLHDTGTSASGATYGAGYYMSANNTCSAISGWSGAQFATNLESCNLGAFLRVEGTIIPGNGVTCPSASDGNGNSKCLDRFYYTQSTGTGADLIDNWSNLTSTTSVPNQPCTASTGYPQGDVELTMFGAWTVDVIRVNCVDTTNHIIYLAGPTKAGAGTNYNFMGPTIGHRFVIENSYDAFTAAQAASQVGIWFLDRHLGPGNWVLNYIANSNSNENPANDTVVIPQLPQTGAQFPAGGQFPQISGGRNQNDYIGGSLLWATGLQYVTFNGITFEADNFYPNYAISANNYQSGFNNDVNGEMPVPQAIDCENCQFVTFNGVTARHMSASGLLAAATATTTSCSTNAAPTTSSFCDLIENSSFYDIGDSGIRIGHFPQSSDSTAVVQDVLVQNNRVQGFSRVLADGEGITQANGFYNQILNNTVTDGYHAGVSICYDSCGHNAAGTSKDGNNVVVNNNLISNLMQGITSDGGSLYFNVGGSVGSATGDQIYGNVVYDTTDSYIIDVLNGTKVAGSGYGGEGIYLDAQTAYADVENNVVFNVDGNAVHVTQGLASQGETANLFQNNIFAFGYGGMFTQDSPWATNGCPGSGGQILEVKLIDNLFVFDIQSGQAESGRAPFSAIQGCKDSCISSTGAASYSDYQFFQGNAYWSFVESFGTVSDAFSVLKNQGAGGLNSKNSCLTGSSNMQNLTFDTPPDSWQTGNVPVPMAEDSGGTAGTNPHANNSNFPTSGTSANVPSNFTINNGTGLGGFNATNTNATITNAGSSVGAPSTTCSTVTPSVNVCPTYPTFIYGSGSLIF